MGGAQAPSVNASTAEGAQAPSVNASTAEGEHQVVQPDSDGAPLIRPHQPDSGNLPNGIEVPMQGLKEAPTGQRPLADANGTDNAKRIGSETIKGGAVPVKQGAAAEQQLDVNMLKHLE